MSNNWKVAPIETVFSFGRIRDLRTVVDEPCTNQEREATGCSDAWWTTDCWRPASSEMNFHAFIRDLFCGACFCGGVGLIAIVFQYMWARPPYVTAATSNSSLRRPTRSSRIPQWPSERSTWPGTILERDSHSDAVQCILNGRPRRFFRQFLGIIFPQKKVVSCYSSAPVTAIVLLLSRDSRN